MRRTILVGLALGTLAAAACGRGKAPAPEPAAAGPPGMVVSATWLAEHAADSGVVVLQVAAERASAPPIPGAGFVPLDAVAPDRGGAANELPPLDELRAVFERAGVGDSSRVVLIGEPLDAARAFLALDVLGHTRTSLLDGGQQAWQDAGAPTVIRAAAPGSITSEPRPDRVVDAQYVRDRFGDTSVLLLDARSEERYHEGRIPGAATLYWRNTLLSSGRLLPTAELHLLFDNAGGDLAREFVVYCRSGVQASFLYFVARSLGYDVRLYDGSFADWSARALPVEQ